MTTAVDSRTAADALARGAVEARLAACAQVSGPITSTYHWQGGIETTEEWTVAFKTTTAMRPALEQHIAGNHPYDVPEILVSGVDASAPYLAWLREETARPAG